MSQSVKSTEYDVTGEEGNDKVLCLGKRYRLGGSYEPVHITNWERYMNVARISFDKRSTVKFHKVSKRSDFNFLGCIGTGAFSIVMAALEKDTGLVYAVKVIEKKNLSETRLNAVKNEKRLLQGIRFPFTIYLEYFFQNKPYLYLVLPLVPGGNLYDYLQEKGVMEEGVAKFYVGQMVLGLEYLHRMGLVYRTLRPDNVRFAWNGYLRMVNFSHSKQLQGRTYTVCGSPDYLPPEMLNYSGYGHSVDWWQLGVFVYELCRGSTPFYSPEAGQTFVRIITGAYKTWRACSAELDRLFAELFQVNPTKRLGNLTGGVRDVKGHAWFETVNWIQLANQEKPAPYVPFAKNIIPASSDVCSNISCSMNAVINEEDLEVNKQEGTDESFLDF